MTYLFGENPEKIVLFPCFLNLVQALSQSVENFSLLSLLLLSLSSLCDEEEEGGCLENILEQDGCFLEVDHENWDLGIIKIRV